MAKQRPAHADLPFLSALTQCLRQRVLIGRFPLAVCPALHTAPQDIRAPMTSCVGRFRRDQRTRKDWLLFILHRQSFTIIQPDRRLIAVTPSPRWACPLRLPPFSLNSEEPSPRFIYRSREEKELEEECESGFTHCSFLLFVHFPSRAFYFSEHHFPNPQQTNKTGCQGRLSAAIVVLLLFFFLFCRRETLKYCSLSAVSCSLTGGQTFGKRDWKWVCAPSADCVWNCGSHGRAKELLAWNTGSLNSLEATNGPLTLLQTESLFVWTLFIYVFN